MTVPGERSLDLGRKNTVLNRVFESAAKSAAQPPGLASLAMVGSPYSGAVKCKLDNPGRMFECHCVKGIKLAHISQCELPPRRRRCSRRMLHSAQEPRVLRLKIVSSISQLEKQYEVHSASLSLAIDCIKNWFQISRTIW